MQINKNQYLIFKLGKEIYGVPLKEIKTIERKVNILPVSGISYYTKGITNLRGKLIPVLDLKKILDMGETAITSRTCTIIVDVKTDNGVFTNGVITDEAYAIMEIMEEDIEDIKEKVTGCKTCKICEFISGIGKIKNVRVALLDLHKIIETVPDSFAELNINIRRNGVVC
jgi:purine-binding chemotaxis protein CheW